MIDVYYSISPNVTKVYMLLEELGVPYNLIFVNVWSGDHFGEAFRALNPNCKIPVIVDHRPRAGDRQVIFESGAILIYLAEKYGPTFPK